MPLSSLAAAERGDDQGRAFGDECRDDMRRTGAVVPRLA